MYEKHGNHLLGDKIAGTGFSYECICRSCLMLELGPSDTLTIYRGEDACITRKNGQREYYQIKHTDSIWTISRLKEFLQRVNEGLADDPKVFYVFCTNANVNADVKNAFKKIREKWGDRLRRDSGGFDYENPTSKIFYKISDIVKKYFYPRRVSRVLKFDQIENCCSRLLSLEAKFKLQAEHSVNGDEVWELIGLKQLLSEIPSLILGTGLVTWLGLAGKAEKFPSNPLFSAIQKIVFSGEGITLDIEDDLYNLACDWVKNRPVTRLVLLSGVSGTGKTWLLTKLGVRLSSLQFPVYWGDEFAIGAPPCLSELAAWENRPTIVLIDNLIEKQWDVGVRVALTSELPILIIGTTSKPHHNQQINLLRKCYQKRFDAQELEPLLTKKKELIEKIRKGAITSLSEQRKLGSTNIRYAARVLKGQESYSDLISEVLNLWYNDNIRAWLMPLVLCSSLCVKVPRLLLRAVAHQDQKSASELPEDISAIILLRRYEDDQVLWLEDSSVALAVIEKIKNDIGLVAFEELLVDQAIKLIQKVRCNSTLNVQFARQFVREFCDLYPHFQDKLFEVCKSKIFQILSYEKQWALAYIWLPFLPRIQRQREAQKAAKVFFTNKPPQSIADIILLLEAFGDRYARRFMQMELSGTYQGGIELWATLIEHLKALDHKPQKELLRSATKVMQSAQLNLMRLLAMRNIQQELLTLITYHGKPEDREWILEILDKILQQSPNVGVLKNQKVIPQYLKLVSRCIMQPRNGLSLDIIQKVFDKKVNKTALVDLYREAYGEYKSAHYNETQKAFHKKAIQLGLNYACIQQSPTKTNFIWQSLISFAWEWGDVGEIGEVDRHVQQFFGRMLNEDLPCKLFEGTIFTYARSMLNKGGVSTDNLTIFLKFLHSDSRPVTFTRLSILLLSLVASDHTVGNDLAVEARAVLLTIARIGGEKASTQAKKFLQNLSNSLGTVQMNVIEFPKIAEAKTLEAPIVVQLLRCFRHVSWNQSEIEELTSIIYKNWKDRTTRIVILEVLVTLIKFNAAQPAKTILDTLLETSTIDPDILLLGSIWEARFSDLTRSEDYFLKAWGVYVRNEYGAHPQYINQDYIHLAARFDSPKREIFRLCAALTKIGPLEPINDVLQIV